MPRGPGDTVAVLPGSRRQLALEGALEVRLIGETRGQGHLRQLTPLAQPVLAALDAAVEQIGVWVMP